MSRERNEWNRFAFESGVIQSIVRQIGDRTVSLDYLPNIAPYGRDDDERVKHPEVIRHAILTQSCFCVTWRTMRNMVMKVYPDVTTAEAVIARAYEICRAHAIGCNGYGDGLDGEVYFFYPTDEEACEARLRYF